MAIFELLYQKTKRIEFPNSNDDDNTKDEDNRSGSGTLVVADPFVINFDDYMKVFLETQAKRDKYKNEIYETEKYAKLKSSLDLNVLLNK